LFPEELYHDQQRLEAMTTGITLKAAPERSVKTSQFDATPKRVVAHSALAASFSARYLLASALYLLPSALRRNRL
jgi:hypothetical protein